jgi:tryptophan-rich sensory protein
MEKLSYSRFFLCLLACNGAGILGSIGTVAGISSWYPDLNKPEFTPPDWIFLPVWTLLYTLMALALYLVIEKGKKSRAAVIFFGIHLLLNASWSIVFFQYHQIGAALVILIIMWAMIAISIFWFKRFSTGAALLLVPYLAWVSFAGVLNAYILALNVLN